MSQYKQPQRVVIPTPATATKEVFESTTTLLTAHYQPLINLPVLLSNRKGLYGMVINSTINGVNLEDTLGSDNAKACTEMVLNSLSSQFYNSVNK